MKLQLRRFHLNYSLCFVICLLVFQSISAQSCYPNGITFTTQAQVDQFSSQNAGCKIIEGDLRIYGNGITNLDSLYSIEVIQGGLILNFSALTNFEGLNNLDTIYEQLIVGTHNSSLTSFSGLESLKSIGSAYGYDVHYVQLASITDFTGLDSLSSIDGTLSVSNCNNLESLAGLENLKEIGTLIVENSYLFETLEGLGSNLKMSTLILNNLPQLDDLNGCENIDSISILYLDNLSNLVKLDSLSHINSLTRLRIKNCDILTNLDGLEGISSVQTSIRIENNEQLHDLTALDAVDLSNLYELIIRYNPNLSTCEINSICAYLLLEGNASIFDNEVGCDWEFEVIAACCNSDTTWCPEENEFCLPDGEVFSSQIEVDLFPIVNPGCKTVLGDLVIDSDDITQLDSLFSINKIQGDFRLIDNSLMDLEGLHNLDTIVGTFSFDTENSNLTSFDGLQNLKKFGSTHDFNRIRSSYLVDFTGLNNLQKINGTLDIQYCDALMSLNGLGSITEIDALTIDRCDLFSSFQDFGDNADLHTMRLLYLPQFQSFDGFNTNGSMTIFTLSNLHPLTSMSGLSHMTSIDQLFITNCDSLKSLAGLENLTTVETFMRIQYNDKLTDITALENVDLSSMTHLHLRNNPKLSYCAIGSICNYIDLDKPTDFSDNSLGCNNEMHIQYDCDGILSIFENVENSDNFWHNPENWHNNQIPTESSFVIIPTLHNCYIQQDSMANCKMLEIQPNSILTSGNNSQLNIIEE